MILVYTPKYVKNMHIKQAVSQKYILIHFFKFKGKEVGHKFCSNVPKYDN